MNSKGLLLLLAGLSFCLRANAQFNTEGTEPSSTKWLSVQTANYKLIYPEGLDSLAVVYARTLENVRDAVGYSIGMLPNGNYRRPMPVILHTSTADANGMVAWAPHRMELQTAPDYYFPEAVPWEKYLSIHESRHVAQMQLGSCKPFKWLKYPFGELVDGVMAGIYGGPVFLEGDAVLAETALTTTGRGRSADFLEYYRVCFDNGDWRNYWKWLYGSQRYYTPNHYALGYLTLAGSRTLYSNPDITADFYDRILRNGGFLNLQNTIRQSSGKKFSESFAEISRHFADGWKADTLSRTPFMQSAPLTQSGRLFESYSLLETDGEYIYAVKSGKEVTTRLVRIDSSGDQTLLAEFGVSTSRLAYNEADGRIYWSEITPDLRWEQRSFSNIRSIDSSGKIRTLTRNKRYYNPAPCGKLLAVTEFPAEGGSAIVCLDNESGEVVSSTPSPAGMQFVESAWAGGELFVSAISGDGLGIYRLNDLSVVLAPQQSKIGDLQEKDGALLFTSDRNGVFELYSLDTESGKVEELTSSKYGGRDFRFFGGDLVYTSLSPDGRNIHRTAVSDLTVREVNFAERAANDIADALGATEEVAVGDADVEVSAPVRYSKALHLFKFHSWAPVFVDYDDISKISEESFYRSAGLGATAFFQNDLGSAYGNVGYHAAYDGKSGWRHSAQARMTYAGWFPVIEGSLHFNERNRYLYSVQVLEKGRKFRAVANNVPSVEFSIKTYIPFNFSKGGWTRGVIPQISYNVSNDLFGKYAVDKTFLSSSYMNSLKVSLRGYTMMRVAGSAIYPRLGIGAEIGYSTRPAMENVFCDNAYAFIYGYVPGIMRTHGIKLSLLAAMHSTDAPFTQEIANTAPRGFISQATSFLGSYPYRSKMTVDYALPFAPLDWSGLCPVAFLRNFELNVHGDLSFYGKNEMLTMGNLFSAGADLTAVLGNLLWLPYTTRIGISVNYNGGSAYDTFIKSNPQDRVTVGMILNVDL